jgi:hypothetical protein
MKYIPTIDLWNSGIQDALYNGQLKLQVGQWLTCGGANKHKCRFVSASKGLIWVVHWQGSPTATNKQFMRSIKSRLN